MKNVVLYHSGCIDGLFGAAAASMALPEGTLYEPVNYNEPIPVGFINPEDTVYLIDFCYKPEDLDILAGMAKKVVVIDHHETMLNLLNKALEDKPERWPNVELYLDMEDSGAGLAWTYFHPTEPQPQVYRHVADYDLWKFNLPGTKELNAYFNVNRPTFRAIDELVRFPSKLESLMKIGGFLLDQHNIYVERLVGLHRFLLIGGFAVPVVNTNNMYANDVGNRLSKHCVFAATYYDTEEHRCFSLRASKENPNRVKVNEIAEAFGGGGHPTAAGFKVSRDHPLAQI